MKNVIHIINITLSNYQSWSFLNNKNENVPSCNPMPFKKKNENENINGMHVYINTLSILRSRAHIQLKALQKFWILAPS